MGKTFFYIVSCFGIELNISIKKSVLLRFQKDNHEEVYSFLRNNFFQKLLLIVRLCLFPFRATLSKVEESLSYILEAYEFIPEREKYIKQFSPKSTKVQYVLGKKSVIGKRPFKEIMKIWIIFMSASVYNLFLNNKGQIQYIWPLFNFLLAGHKNQKNQFFIFRPYTLVSYLAALIIPEINVNSKVYLVTSNTSFYARRYTYLPKVTLIYCSSF